MFRHIYPGFADAAIIFLFLPFFNEFFVFEVVLANIGTKYSATN